MGSAASRSSNLRSFLDTLDASERVDVATVLPRIEAQRACERRALHRRSHVRRACGLSVRSVDWRLYRGRRLAATVEKLWRGIESVRPNDRTCFLIDTRLAEARGIAQCGSPSVPPSRNEQSTSRITL